MSVVAMPQDVQNKTQQRISALVSLLEKHPSKQFGYDELMGATGMAYDTLLYVLHTLEHMGHVEKFETPDGPGRPKVTFQWQLTRVVGTRGLAAR